MSNLEKTNEKLPNEENKEKGVIEGTKNRLSKLFSAFIIAGMISGTAIAKEKVNEYDEIKDLTSKMKEGDQIELQVKTGDIESMKNKLEEDGFEVKNGKNGKVVIKKEIAKADKESEKEIDEWHEKADRWCEKQRFIKRLFSLLKEKQDRKEIEKELKELESISKKFKWEDEEQGKAIIDALKIIQTTYNNQEIKNISDNIIHNIS